MVTKSPQREPKELKTQALHEPAPLIERLQIKSTTSQGVNISSLCPRERHFTCWLATSSTTSYYLSFELGGDREKLRARVVFACFSHLANDRHINFIWFRAARVRMPSVAQTTWLRFVLIKTILQNENGRIISRHNEAGTRVVSLWLAR